MPFARTLSAAVWLAFWSLLLTIALLSSDAGSFATIAGAICGFATVWYVGLAVLTRQERPRIVHGMLGPTLALTSFLTLGMLMFGLVSLVGLLMAGVFVVGLPLFGLDYWESARQEES